MTRIKICGITSREDGEMALELGANALGFVFEPDSPRYVANFDEAETLPAFFGALVTTFAVYGKLRDEFTGATYRQYVKAGPLTSTHGGILAVRIEPGLKPEALVKFLRSARIAAPLVFLDAYHPKQMGGTGETADWNLAAKIVELMSEQRFVLAGGLNADNVTEAISKVRPYGVDVSSGVERAPGIKDPTKLAAFIAAVRTCK